MSQNSSVLPEASLPCCDKLPTSTTSLKSPFVSGKQQLQRQHQQRVQERHIFSFLFFALGSFCLQAWWKHSSEVEAFTMLYNWSLYSCTATTDKTFGHSITSCVARRTWFQVKGVCSGQGGEYHYLHKSLQWSDYSWCPCVVIVSLS